MSEYLICQMCNAHIFQIDEDEDNNPIYAHLEDVNCDDPTPKDK